MIVADLDDSLLGSDLRISAANKKALLTAADKGIFVTIATGRMFKSALPFIRELSLNIPVITYQGALIKNAESQETLLKKTIPQHYAVEIIRECRRKNIYLQVYLEDEYFFEGPDKYGELYHWFSGIEGKKTDDLEGIMRQEPEKLLIIDETENIKYFREHFNNIYGGEIHIAVSKPFYLEFTNKEANKGKALEYLCNMYGIGSEEVIAIGDSYNDIPMLKFAGLGIAMGNAPDEVKQYADFVTSGNDEDGIAEAINRFVLNGGKTP
jgi:Cof subfamily protein (haloacid dehalogenase superfamily)